MRNAIARLPCLPPMVGTASCLRPRRNCRLCRPLQAADVDESDSVMNTNGWSSISHPATRLLEPGSRDGF